MTIKIRKMRGFNNFYFVIVDSKGRSIFAPRHIDRIWKSEAEARAAGAKKLAEMNGN